MRRFTSAARLALATLLVVSAVVIPASLSAQDSATRPVFLAIPDVFPNLDARVVLVREPGREIVVLDPATATADELGTGLRLLARVRRERGEAKTGEVIPILGFAPGQPNLSRPERARLDALITELRERPVAQVGNLGRGRWIRYRER